jgi:LuxR family maltose regulon positive regulatory protein
MARIQAAEGDLDSALRLTDEAQGRYAADFFPDVRPIAAIRARLWIAQGRWAKALAWARERALSVDDELAYMREFEHITLARALLARARANEDDASRSGANDLLERLLDAAEQGGRGGSVIEVLLLQALARQAAGDHAAAIENVTRALVLAETEGYVRIFLDEGPAMAELVTRATRNGVQTDHARRLLAAFRGRRHRAPLEQPLVEPLSERELDVLRLLDTDLAGPDIARELVVSVATVRTHTQNIYTKLGVNNRRAAVRRADELSLLAGPRVRAPRERRGGEA